MRPLQAMIHMQLVACVAITALLFACNQTNASILMRVCDTREIKTVTARVCMLYKRTANSKLKMDRQGNLRVVRDAGDAETTLDPKVEHSPAKLAAECCKVGCPPHIFAFNC